MHVAFIMDDERLFHERAMLNRLSIGLMAEGAQLTRVMPGSDNAHVVDDDDRGVALVPRIDVPLKVLPWLRQSRMERLMEAFEKSPPDVLYAVGQRTWPLAMQLAQALDRPLTIDIHSVSEARAVPRSGATGSSEHIAGYIAPCTYLASELQRRFDPSLVHLVPMGVAIPSIPHNAIGSASREAALVIVGDGRDVRAYSVLFEGLARVARNTIALQLFLELRGPNEHEVWRRTQSPDLVGRVSAFGDAALYRSLLTQCDIMLIPESDNRLRSVILEAMALGLPIVSKPDPVLEMLVDGETALLVEPCDSGRWEKLVHGLIEAPDRRHELGVRARACVAQTYRSSDQVAKLMDVLTRIAFGRQLHLNRGNPSSVN